MFHPIMTTFRPPAPIADVLQRIRLLVPAGTQVWSVGGTVRDVLLVRSLHDIDIAVEGDAIAFARLLSERMHGHFVLFDDDNGAARVVLDGEQVTHVDVVGVRGSLEEDLRRRDFTVDALAAPLLGGPVIDVTGGIADLDAGLVRMTSAMVLDTDPLRLLRAVRIAGELGFEIEPATADEIASRATKITDVAGERVRDELARVLALGDTYGALLLADRLGLMDALLPELTMGRGVKQDEGWHSYDVFEHNLRAVEAVETMLTPARPTRADAFLWEGFWTAFAWYEDDLRSYLAEELSERRPRLVLLKLAALLHDVAKPQTRTVEADGRVRFLGHTEQGATTARRIMRRLRFSANEIRFVSRLVEVHLRPVQLAQIGEVPTRRALYRFFRDLGDGVPGVLILGLADAAASRGQSMTSTDWSRHVLYMNSLLMRSRKEEGILDPPRLLNGNDIMSRLGMPAGPAIGKVLEALREAQAAGEVTDRDGAWAFVREQAEAVRADEEG
jgi:putative nucleotidyltransferase with HDIG domain